MDKKREGAHGTHNKGGGAYASSPLAASHTGEAGMCVDWERGASGPFQSPSHSGGNTQHAPAPPFMPLSRATGAAAAARATGERRPTSRRRRRRKAGGRAAAPRP